MVRHKVNNSYITIFDQRKSNNALDPTETQSSFLLFLALTECRVKLESVQMEKPMIFHGQESNCFSVEPVLRCLPGCFPVKTTAVTVGFHCAPIGEFSLQNTIIILHLSVHLLHSHFFCRFKHEPL